MASRAVYLYFKRAWFYLKYFLNMSEGQEVKDKNKAAV